MDKLVNFLFGTAIAICVLMMTLCMLLLPDNPPPEWLGYTAITAVAVCAGMACAIGFFGSIRSDK